MNSIKQGKLGLRGKIYDAGNKNKKSFARGKKQFAGT
jgi:hypothetical protein